MKLDEFKKVAGPSEENDPAAAEQLEQEKNIDFSQVPEWALQWIQAASRLLSLDELYWKLDDLLQEVISPYGFNQEVESLLGRVTNSVAQEIRPYLTSIYGHGGVPTARARARIMLEALESRAYDSWLAHEREENTKAEELIFPLAEPTEGLDAYRERLRTWAASKPGDLLKRAGFNINGLVRDEEAQREAARKNLEAEQLAAITEQLRAALRVETAQEAVAAFTAWREEMHRRVFDEHELGYYTPEYAARTAVPTSGWQWCIYASVIGDVFAMPEVPKEAPMPEDVEGISTNWILWYVDEMRQQSRTTPLQTAVAELWPLETGRVRLVQTKNRKDEVQKYAIYPGGGVKCLISNREVPKPGVYPTTPGPDGWWSGKVLQGYAMDEGCWCEPAVYEAMQRLEKAVKGSAFLPPETLEFWVNPDLQFKLGDRSSTYVLRVWRPTGGEKGWLVQRLDDIKLLRAHNLPISENAYWMDVQLSTSRGITTLCPGQPAERVTLAFVKGTRKTNGPRHPATGYVPSPVSVNPTHGGARILGEPYFGSNGRGLSSGMLVFWLPLGGSIDLTSGNSLIFDGEHVKEVNTGSL
ncbi:MAG TPA: hypothetical protein VNG90_03235 [Candidatus Acidoferrum sp.]|nr:hypothetical protein [Candidatus Acidoferrum sp.]